MSSVNSHILPHQSLEGYSSGVDDALKLRVDIARVGLGDPNGPAVAVEVECHSNFVRRCAGRLDR